MDYREFTSLDTKTSLLGFGCMRFPIRKTDGKIADRAATKLLKQAYAAGVNYFDTAYNYHSGESEAFVGKFLDGCARESYYLATKLPTFLVKSLDDAKRIFEEQLTRLHKDYIDFYLLHTLSGKRFRTMVELGVVDWCRELQAAGKIRHFGFSFHDDYPAFEEIMSHHKWDFCQLQLNYMDTDIQAGMKGYALTEQMGVPLIVMEPVKGGLLAALPEDAAAGLLRARPGASLASWALRWAGSLPNVMTVLSGMTMPGQVEDNLATFASFQPLTDVERTLVEETAGMLRAKVKNGCTGCRYCMPCPAGVDIPENFSIWNEFGIYGNRESSARSWSKGIGAGAKAGHCVECGKCEEVCPQKLSIRADLKRVQCELDELNRR